MATEIAAAVAIVGALLGSLWCYLRWRAKLTPEVRRLMIEMRAMLEGLIIEGGGLHAAGFAAVARRQAQALEDLIDRVNDRKLRQRCNEALKAWRDVWSSAPAGREEAVPLAVGVYAITAQQAIGMVCKRVNTLERLLPPRN